MTVMRTEGHQEAAEITRDPQWKCGNNAFSNVGVQLFSLYIQRSLCSWLGSFNIVTRHHLNRLVRCRVDFGIELVTAGYRQNNAG